MQAEKSNLSPLIMHHYPTEGTVSYYPAFIQDWAW